CTITSAVLHFSQIFMSNIQNRRSRKMELRPRPFPFQNRQLLPQRGILQCDLFVAEEDEHEKSKSPENRLKHDATLCLSPSAETNLFAPVTGLGKLEIPPISTRLVDRSMKNRTVNRFRPVHVHTSTVKKSVAMICDQCRRRNSFHVVFRFRSGAGSMP